MSSKSQKKAVILLSGGLDSTTCLALARAQGFAPYCLSMNYGQRHTIELERATEMATELGAIEHKIATIDLGLFGGSALTDSGIDVPAATPLGSQDIPITYVPARNTIFLSYALAYSEVVGANDLFIGVNALDYSGYPDCRPEYIQAFETLANLATKAAVEGNHLHVHTPLIDMTKAEIIQTGWRLGVDYDRTISCYNPSSAGEPCQSCDACYLRAKGFAEAKKSDNLAVK